ncbi:hypothetical protein [Azospirillum argentinense]
MQEPVREFIRRMEAPRVSSGKKPIRLLIADGEEVAGRLAAARSELGADRVAALRSAVQPYLQLATDKVIDAHTGHNLREVWRYFRYTWSIPQVSTPGRQLLYLIRDAAHPHHAIMGIAALNNCPLQMGEPREAHIGWHFTSLLEEARKAVSCGQEALQELMDWLNMQLELALGDVDATNLVTPDEVNNPTDRVVARLRRQSGHFADVRIELLRQLASDQSGTPDLPMDEAEMEGGLLGALPASEEAEIDGEQLDSRLLAYSAEIENGQFDAPPVSDEVLRLEPKASKNERMHEARRHLIAKKRAALLAELLQARIVLSRHAQGLRDTRTALETLESDEVRVACNTIIDTIKSRHAGTNMLELTTCGAIQPYGRLLGGKLVALLMLSPEVAADYRDLYSGASIIFSQMKNQPIVRDNKLVYLGTTSLYGLGSSQYSRVRLPKGIISEEQEEIGYKFIGETSGYGTVQFSPETARAVDELMNSLNAFKDVNSVFGEGASPKLRKIRAGMSYLGFNPERLLSHRQHRLIYACSLFPDARPFLKGRKAALPDYVLNPSRFRDATERIAEYWRARWLASRLDHVPTMSELALDKGWLLGDVLPLTRDRSETLEVQLPAPETAGQPQNITPDACDLWRTLARAGSKVTADALTAAELDRMHLPLELDRFLLQKVEQGLSLVVTGNAGDGKTHLLRRLAEELRNRGAIVEEDATAAMRRGDIGPVVAQWQTALAQGKPFCLAVNEYPLYRLRTSAAAREAIRHLPEVDRQCRNRLAYGPITDVEDARENVLVVDLSLRNPLSLGFAGALLDRLLSDPGLKGLVESGNDPVASYNYARLGEPRVRERLLALLDRLAALGRRATVRELWILMCRMVLGYRNNEDFGELRMSRWYSEVLFAPDERFDLASAMTLVDPARLSHPVWDVRLELGKVAQGWIRNRPITRPMPVLKDEEFSSVKRAFYFEHERGDELSSLDDPDVRSFMSLLKGASENDYMMKRQLVMALNAAFCPTTFPALQEHLYLWSGHRFHDQPSRSFVASQRVAVDDLRIEIPRLPKRVEGGPAYQPDHVVLTHGENANAIRLKIDFDLFRSLQRLSRGLPRKLIPDRDVNRVETFLERLSASRAETRRTVMSAHLEHLDVIEVVLSNDGKAYQKVIQHA